MADWAYAPRFDEQWEDEGAPTLITRLSDGKTMRRQKHANAPQTWSETYDFNASQHDTAHTFYQSKYKVAAFTKVSYDVGGTPTQERSVYFASVWSVTRAGPDWFVVTLSFERLY